MTVQCKRLDEANRAWEQYQQNQLTMLHSRFQLTKTDNLSFDDAIEQIESRFVDLQNQYRSLTDRIKDLESMFYLLKEETV